MLLASISDFICDLFYVFGELEKTVICDSKDFWMLDCGSIYVNIKFLVISLKVNKVLNIIGHSSDRCRFLLVKKIAQLTIDGCFCFMVLAAYGVVQSFAYLINLPFAGRSNIWET